MVLRPEGVDDAEGVSADQRAFGLIVSGSPEHPRLALFGPHLSELLRFCSSYSLLQTAERRSIFAVNMDKLLEFGRRAMFLIRVLSGYEERRIRSYRLELQKRIDQAQARKVELRKNPEKVILSEVRRMVEEMQALNQKLEETEAAIEEYFKPIDKNAEILMNMQLEKEEKQMKEMIKAMHEQAMLQKEIAEKTNISSKEASNKSPDTMSTSSNSEKLQ